MVKFCKKIRSPDFVEIRNLSAQAANGMIPCVNKQTEEDGDVRYWGVDVSASPFLAEFLNLAREESERFYGPGKSEIILMINYISAKTSPGGSGGGWHVDSIRPQCKLFCYLTDCEKEVLGPLCLLVHRYRFVEKAAILANRTLNGGRRFGECAVELLSRIGFKKVPVLSKKGVPFFVETNRIHRGLPIKEGSRTMLTAYMYQDRVPESTQSRLSS